MLESYNYINKYHKMLNIYILFTNPSGNITVTLQYFLYQDPIYHKYYILTNRIYSSESPGRSSSFEFSKGGAYSREALFRGRHSWNSSKGHENTFNLSLKSNNNDSNNNRRIDCLMFKIVCKTPLFTKEKQHCKLNQLYYRIFYVLPK